MSQPQAPHVDETLAQRHGLSGGEYARITALLGRTPTYAELGMFSVMWSEHCSYKNSIAELKKLPRSGGKLLVAAGEENAGLVDIGDGLAVAFKIESHNHPSAVEPYQGAATGVGGIMRDIFTMGARPIASLNSLRFGDPRHPRTRYLVKGIVKGIGDYGNSFGVPTVAGEIYFDGCYNENPLVNAMAVGIVRTDAIARAAASGEGNIVLIVGSSTGRDGIHGATFASEDLSEESASRRPSVQVGDPFTEKLLLEATLEAIRGGYVVGIQDMGAAGITCSTSEMSARGGCGMTIDIRSVPLREEGMSAYEILLSESQERMLLVARPGDVPAVTAIFAKWDLACRPIGRVEGGGKLSVLDAGSEVASIPADSLVLGGGAPVYEREAKEPAYLAAARKEVEVGAPHDCGATLLALLRSPNICSRRWVTTQYDSTVRTNTLAGAARDAAVVRIKGTKKALALKTDCNARYVWLNPYRGAQIAVAESARNVVCTGALPLAITNCLNFGNPYNPEVYWQFREAVRGIGDACRALGTPVTGGNVSFYNESPSGPIQPTPVIGMLGEIDDFATALSAGFKEPGDLILLLGVTHGHLGGSEYLRVAHGIEAGDAPPLDLEAEKRLHACVLGLKSLIRSAHDPSEGGAAVALAECVIFAADEGRALGAKITAPGGIRLDRFLFGEDQSRIIVTCRKADAPRIVGRCDEMGVPAAVVGEVTGGGRLEIGELSLDAADMAAAYNGAFGMLMEDGNDI